MQLQPIRPDHVAIYIRWSTDDQGDGTTAEVQRDGCKHYILSQGWTFNPDLLFVDDGWSGGDLNRPGLSRLREAVKRGLVDCVVVFKIDRLSRNVVDTVNLVLREWDGRCHVKSAREAIDTATPAGKMFFYTLVSFAEWERSVIRDRTQSGKLKRLQEGRNPGFRPAYGLKAGAAPGSFAAVPEEADIVRLIFQKYLTGQGYKAIAVHLNERGIRFRGGRPFSARTVYEVLINPIYTGTLVYGRRITNPRRSDGGARQVKNRGEPISVTSAALPVIIDPATFEQAQALRSRRAEGRRPARSLTSDHLLTGLLRCRCGSSLIGLKGRTPYYACTGRRSKGPGFCAGAHIRQETLDRWMAAQLLQRHGGQVAQDRYLIQSAEQVRTERAALQAMLHKTEQERQSLDKELAVVARDYRRELLTLEEYREQRRLVDQRQAELTARHRDLTERLLNLEQQTRQDELILAQLARLDRWASLPQSERKLVARQLVREVTAYLAPASGDLEVAVTWVVT